MPKSWFWDRIELASEITGAAQVAGLAPEEAGILGTLVGRRARVVTPLRPFGQVEIDGKFYEARLPLGTLERDATVIVRGCNDFSLDVESAESTNTTNTTNTANPAEPANPANPAGNPKEDNA
jgi:membrane-bound serine protease (ClpP class)